MKKSTSQFVTDAKKIHGDKYDYTITLYKGAHNQISYYCPKHGLVNQSSASNHLAGKGCKLCKGDLITTKKTKSFEDFPEKAKIVHPQLYNYNQTGYVDRKTKLNIFCIRCKSNFMQTPNAHLVGKGCNKCNRIKSTWEKEMIRKNFRKINKKHMFIYRTTNLINGKIYIGQHATNNLDDKYIGSGRLITKAIKKHGIEKFKFEIIQFASSYSELDDLEIKLISSLETNDESIGYNIHRGGLGGNAYKKVNQYDLSGKYIKTWNALIEASETLGISYKTIQSCAKFIKKSSGGFQWRAYEENQDCSNISAYSDNTIKAVNQYHSDGRFIRKWPSSVSAGYALNTNSSSIGQCCHRQKSVLLIGGFAWRFTDEFPENVNIEPISRKNTKKISQFDLNGNLIRIFDTITEASTLYKIPTSNISKCCKGTRKSVGGYKWQYFS